MKTYNKFSIHALVCLTLLLCSVTTAFAQTPTLHANGKIAFTDVDYASPYYRDDGQVGISVMNPDGSGRTQLTSSPFKCPQLNRPPGSCGPDQMDYNPSWSPDGHQIAFIRGVPTPNFGFESDVFVMNADGSNQRRLTQIGSVFGSRPTWSPDGTKLAFIGPAGVYVINADGSNQQSIGNGIDVAWSPDGSKLAIAFNGLYLTNSDGSGRTQITAPTGRDYEGQPAWSPDGSRILFNHFADCDISGNCDTVTIWTVNADGTNPAKLANVAAYEGLAWSPDGTKIVFEWVGGDDQHNGNLFTMDADGSNITRLTNTPNEFEAAPSWQPLAPAGCAYANPIDCPDFFISQQYRDFLGREPEGSCPPGQCGLDFYLPILNGCAASDAECIRYTRGALSANFFRSPEFQRKGSYVMYLYMVSLGQRPVTVGELSDQSKIERPHFAEFTSDLGSISTPNDDPALTEAKKNDLANAWIQRAEIVQKYSGLSNAAFVQTLLDTAGVTISNQSQLVSDLNMGARTRAQVLRAIAESPEVNAKFYKAAFVTMEYFGYLRRDPEDCHNSANWSGGDPNNCGYIFHNSRFNLSSDADLIENLIVRGFIESPEYRHRFGS